MYPRTNVNHTESFVSVISRSRRRVYVSHMTPIENDEEGGRTRREEKASVLSSLLSGCSLKWRGKKKKRGQRWLESRRGTKMPTDGRRGSRISGYLTLKGTSVAPPTVPRTLNTPVGGSTSTGAELPGQDDPSRRRDARSPALPNVEERTHTGRERRRVLQGIRRPPSGWFALPLLRTPVRGAERTRGTRALLIAATLIDR